MAKSSYVDIIKRVIKYLLLLILAVGLLFYTFKGIKWADFLEGLKDCNFLFIALSMVVGVAGFIFRGLRWWLLLINIDSNIKRVKAINGVNIAYLTNFVLPRAGEIARCTVVAKNSKVPFESAIASVVVERALDLICLLLLTIVIIFLRWSSFGSFLLDNIFNPFLNLFNSLLLPLIIIVLTAALLIFFIYKYWEKIKSGGVGQKVAKILSGLKDGFATAANMRQKRLFFLYTLFIWVTYWLTSFLTIKAFPIAAQLDATDALFLMIVGGMGWVVPVQGGIGAYHLIVSLALLVVYSIPQTQGVVFATISHESQAIAMIICGIISLILFAIEKKRDEN